MLLGGGGLLIVGGLFGAAALVVDFGACPSSFSPLPVVFSFAAVSGAVLSTGVGGGCLVLLSGLLGVGVGTVSLTSMGSGEPLSSVDWFSPPAAASISYMYIETQLSKHTHKYYISRLSTYHTHCTKKYIHAHNMYHSN